MLSDIEKKRFYQSFFEDVQIYEEQQENGQLLKSVRFKLPVFFRDKEVEEIRWDKENTVGTAVLLQRERF